MIRFEKATPEDAVVLTEISKRAFDNDVNYGAPGPGGPWGYDSVENQIQMINGTPYYKILFGDAIIGGIVVIVQKDGKYNLMRMFIEPDYQNQGIGAQAVEFIFREFPDANVWTLDTPAWNLRTRHFYEKLGFQIDKIENNDVFYEKKVGESG